MTTNGVSLPLLAPALKAKPGCDGSTSRSTRCRRDRFEELTRRDELHRVLEGIDAALLTAGFDPVKINVVVMKR